MASSYPADMRQQVVEFAATYPTPNTRLAVQLAQSGRITWEEVYDLFKAAVAKGLATVAPKPTAQPPRAGLVACPNGCGHWVVEGVYIDPTLPCPC